MSRRIINIIRKCGFVIIRLRNTLLKQIYAAEFGCPAGSFSISGKCDVHIEGECRVGKRLYLRSRDNNRIQIRVTPRGRLTIGDDVFLNQGVRITATREVKIGNRVLIGDDVIILDSDFHGVKHAQVKSLPVIIEDDVWIASRAIILRGVTIGKGAVVGAGTVVTKSVPPDTLMTGHAAQAKKYLQ